MIYTFVPKLAGGEREVLYIGDHEVGGPADSIEGNTRRVLEQEIGHNLRWTRIALTQAQVDANPRLMRLVITKTDKRFKPPRQYQAIECEAVGQRVLERLLREALDSRLPEPLAAIEERENKQIAEALEWLRAREE